MRGGWVEFTRTVFLVRYAECILKLSISTVRLQIMKKFILVSMSHVFTQVPASSGSKGIKISNMLQAAGKSVIGWDMEWPVNWSTNRLKIGGEAMYRTVNSGAHTKVKIYAITIFKATFSPSLKKYSCRNSNLLFYYSHQEKQYYSCTTLHIETETT